MSSTWSDSDAVKRWLTRCASCRNRRWTRADTRLCRRCERDTSEAPDELEQYIHDLVTAQREDDRGTGGPT